jgi:hypothetical protein
VALQERTVAANREGADPFVDSREREFARGPRVETLLELCEQSSARAVAARRTPPGQTMAACRYIVGDCLTTNWITRDFATGAAGHIERRGANNR